MKSIIYLIAFLIGGVAVPLIINLLYDKFRKGDKE